MELFQKNNLHSETYCLTSAIRDIRLLKVPRVRKMISSKKEERLLTLKVEKTTKKTRSLVLRVLKFLTRQVHEGDTLGIILVCIQYNFSLYPFG